MSHSLIVISPVDRLHDVNGHHVEPLGTLIGGDGVLSIPLVDPDDPDSITHYTCHAGGLSAYAVAKIEAIYAGQVSTLPNGWTAQDVSDALTAVRVSIDGRLMGVDADYPSARLTGRAHMDAVLTRVGLLMQPVGEAI